MWRILLSFLIIIINGWATLSLLNKFRPTRKYGNIETALYSFSLGYSILTLIGVAFAQFGILNPSIRLLTCILIPFAALLSVIHQKKKRNLIASLSTTSPIQNTSDINNRAHSQTRLSTIVLLAIFSAGLILRLESQLSVEWLGDMDPYYHLSFIDAIIAQGTLPAQTFWGSYSYPPSFHIVFATLISTTQAERFAFMKIVPEFLGFLCVPAVYLLTKRRYGEWAGIAAAAFLAICSFHIYRTNIAIPEPLALLAMLMFFHANNTQEGTKKYVLGMLFASMVFLTNIVGIVYFLPCALAVSVTLLLSKRRNESINIIKTLFPGTTLFRNLLAAHPLQTRLERHL